ncbi:MAG: DUF1003 domain-containing protein [Armatimonadetes bacterium]|nr:DUF1003 domain-containing protein [Armatimonadota bacterium]MDE2205098.1 DUF1003 domain-containing protein [Armatimonadota bacterium]
MTQATPPARPPKLAELRKRIKPPRDINSEHEQSLTMLDRAALLITERVGTMGFFLIILVWTVVWTGYNIAASELPALRLHAFDPFPAFVAYLLISNVIQILLMPLIMVGQNLQGRHSELRAQNDFEVNVKAEKEVELILEHLEYQADLILQLLKTQGRKLDAALVPDQDAPPAA